MESLGKKVDHVSSRYDALSIDSSDSTEPHSMLWLARFFVAGYNRQSHLISFGVTRLILHCEQCDPVELLLT